MFSRKNVNTGRSGSMGLALLFLMIAVLGIVMTMNRKPQRPQLAMPDSSYVVPEYSETARSFGSFIARTVAVTGLIIMVLLMVRKYLKKHNVSDGSGRFQFEVLGKRYLSPKQYLAMVRVENSRILLGVTDHSINLIREFPETEEDETFEQSTPMSATQSFIKMFKKEAGSDAGQNPENKDR
jgi:flagellar biogenesis protein FliO